MTKYGVVLNVMMKIKDKFMTENTNISLLGSIF